MTKAEDLYYTELKKEMIDSQTVDDINHLLPQLSLHAPPVTETRLDYILDSGTRPFVAMHATHIVGIVLLSPMVILVGQKDWIEDVVIDTKYRRLGIASKLMDMAEEASKRHKAQSVNLTSGRRRSDAHQLYRDRGYLLRDTDVFRRTF